jgi:MFS family permease
MDEKARRASLRYSVKEGVAWSTSNALGPSYIAPYAIALNANNLQIGLLTSVPILAANLSEVRAPKLMEKMTRKRIVTVGDFIQALMLLPIASLAFIYPIVGPNSLIAPTILILLYTIYLMLNSFTNPAWSSWMGDLVREKERGRFFSRRNVFTGIASISAMFVAGVFLNLLTPKQALFGFATLFVLASIALFISWHYFRKQYEPKFKYKDEFYFSFASFLKRMKNNNFGRFTIYVSLMVFALNLANPFFAVYMLRQLHFGYLTFVAITLSSSIATVVSMRLWGRFSDRYGNLLVLRTCGFLVPLAPILWLFSINPIYLAGVQALAGVFWGGFNLAASNYIYDCVSQQRRGICFAYSDALNGIGIFLGATVGGLIATYVNVGFISILLFLFLVSGLLRLAFSAVMLPGLREVRHVEAPKPIRYYLGSLSKRLPLHPHHN